MVDGGLDAMNSSDKIIRLCLAASPFSNISESLQELFIRAESPSHRYWSFIAHVFRWSYRVFIAEGALHYDCYDSLFLFLPPLT
jgi:hypothetical protein